MRRCLTTIAFLVFPLLGSLEAVEDRALEGRDAVTTAKERLVNKASDPQRINDCKVPSEKRSMQQARPNDCSHLNRNKGLDPSK